MRTRYFEALGDAEAAAGAGGFLDDLRGALRRLVLQHGNQQRLLVSLNVYDVNPRLGWLRGLGLGALHTGVVLLGCEVAYAGHSGADTGVFAAAPGTGLPGLRLLRGVELGVAEVDARRACQLVLSLSARFTGRGYSMLYRNCNHFSQALCNALFGRRVFPLYINRVATLGAGLCNALRCFGVDLGPAFAPVAGEGGEEGARQREKTGAAEGGGLLPDRPAEQPWYV